MVFAKKEFMEEYVIFTWHIIYPFSYVPTIFDNFDVSLTVDGKNIELSGTTFHILK